MSKPDFCKCENKDAAQPHGNREADQRLCFRHTDSAIPLLPKSEISSLWSFSVAVQHGLCRTWSETPNTGLLTTRLKYKMSSFKSSGNIQKKECRQDMVDLHLRYKNPTQQSFKTKATEITITVYYGLFKCYLILRTEGLYFKHVGKIT